jgi:ABC-type Fe3+-siderophore transport system permease subunit
MENQLNHENYPGAEFDFLCGVIPALTLSTLGIFVLFQTTSIWLLLIAATGSISSLALMYTIIVKNKTKYPLLICVLLLAGIVVSALMINSLSQMGIFVLIPLPIMISLCALKYVIALTRFNLEVRP